MSSKLLMVSQGHSKTAVHITSKVKAVQELFSTHNSYLKNLLYLTEWGFCSTKREG